MRERLAARGVRFGQEGCGCGVLCVLCWHASDGDDGGRADRCGRTATAMQ